MLLFVAVSTCKPPKTRHIPDILVETAPTRKPVAVVVLVFSAFVQPSYNPQFLPHHAG
ncbi:MAG: hypothetical protein MJE68_05695 [Proteobacteria bacterium]|nr:hypothetical protein [Pseudomonadota bacterium]